MTTVGFTDELSHSSKLAVGIAARSFGAAQIRAKLIAMRGELRAFVCGLTEAQLTPLIIETINPPLWEAAHVAWFAEWWCVRDAYNTDSGDTRADRGSIWDGCDAFLNSNTIAHAARWSVPQLTRASTLDYLDRSLAATLERLDCAEPTDDALYPFRLAMFHEAMHLEAIAWCAQTLAWPMPAWVDGSAIARHAAPPADGFVVQTRLLNVDTTATGFCFDNERNPPPPKPITTPLSSALVSNAQYAQFVESGAFEATVRAEHPRYWRRSSDGAWQQRRFDQWIALAPNEPVIHISAIEAEAFAEHHGGRLPTEPELARWLTLPSPNGATAWHGAVWEWTLSDFAPYENFKPDRYREYSAPWFDGQHRVLRGASFATLNVMHHPNYRNFFQPQRGDVFAGFRVVDESAQN
ncbi:MAG: ergothioneine biosynthesis protein EgtB [Betaproteobacteria bacterium]|nr:MAG: ergothioneine biosynthesis protein EgtB [Betaproteobacteria bacterium]